MYGYIYAYRVCNCEDCKLKIASVCLICRENMSASAWAFLSHSLSYFTLLQWYIDRLLYLTVLGTVKHFIYHIPLSNNDYKKVALNHVWDSLWNSLRIALQNYKQSGVAYPALFYIIFWRWYELHILLA